MESMADIIITSIVTGCFTGIATVAAIKVNISWLIKATDKNERAINRAHERIDQAERRLSEYRLNNPL